MSAQGRKSEKAKKRWNQIDVLSRYGPDGITYARDDKGVFNREVSFKGTEAELKDTIYREIKNGLNHFRDVLVG